MRKQTRISSVLVLAGLAVQAPPHAVSAGELEYGGLVAGDVRVYDQSSPYPDVSDAVVQPSGKIEPEIAYYGDNFEAKFVGYGRYDPFDETRTHWDIREAYVGTEGNGWDLRVGVDSVFWGVAESRHLVDVINQQDLLESGDGEAKLGQPMVRLGLHHDIGDVDLYVMPRFRERHFPGKDSRQRGELLIDEELAEFKGGMGEWTPDFAVRGQTVIDDFDLGLSYFHGTSREPRMEPVVNSQGQTVLKPIYDIVDQVSFDGQATIEEWLFKLEALYRTGHGKGFGAVTTGVEYTGFGWIGEDGDLGLLAEFHFDDRHKNAPATMFDQDIFVGARVTLNDEDDTSMLLGSIIDLETGATVNRLEAETRISDGLVAGLEASVPVGLTRKDPLYGARRDRYVQMRLSYYF